MLVGILGHGITVNSCIFKKYIFEADKPALDLRSVSINNNSHRICRYYVEQSPEASLQNMSSPPGAVCTPPPRVNILFLRLEGLQRIYTCRGQLRPRGQISPLGANF
jgi:hypothetical protein